MSARVAEFRLDKPDLLDEARPGLPAKPDELAFEFGDDGGQARLGGQADAEGTLDLKSSVRAAALVLVICAPGSARIWRSQRLAGSAGGIFELGEVVLRAKVE